MTTYSTVTSYNIILPKEPSQQAFDNPITPNTEEPQ
jgi:hypothetical protein